MRPILGFVLALASLPSTLCAAVVPNDDQGGPGVTTFARPGDPPIPYVVVTDRHLRGAFMPLIHARTNGGLPAAIVTLDEIEAGYPAGVDLAERIRMFLKDAYANRGTRWVLLGGDASVVPMRRARLRIGLSFGDRDLPTDQYYACLDGTWNADGDSLWGELPGPGEPGDDVDLIPELFVGRAPVRSADEVAAFVRRTLDYDGRLAAGPHRSALLAADVINGVADGAQATEVLRPALEADPHRTILRLYENAAAWPGSQQESRTSLLAALDGGFDLAVLVGAGGHGILVAGEDYCCKDYVTADDLLGLGNAPLYPFVYVLSAYTTDPDPPLSIGAALMHARHGGAAAVIGSTDLQLVSIADFLMFRFFDAALGATPAPTGEALARAITATVGALPPDDLVRLTFEGNVLFGDPALRVDPALPTAPLDLVAVGRPRARMQGRSLTVPQVVTAEAGDAARALALGANGGRGTALAMTDIESPPGEATVTTAKSLPSPPRTAPMRTALDAVSPARSRTTLRFAFAPEAAGARYELAVFDLMGRRVRTLDRGTAVPGRSEIAWDLRTDAGAMVPDGLYFARLSFAGTSVSRRLLVSK